jgi:hypothetical protein
MVGPQAGCAGHRGRTAGARGRGEATSSLGGTTAAPRAGAPGAASCGHVGAEGGAKREGEGGAAPVHPRRARRAPWLGRAWRSHARTVHAEPGGRHGRRDQGRRRGVGKRRARGSPWRRGSSERVRGRRGRRGGEGERDRVSRGVEESREVVFFGGWG